MTESDDDEAFVPLTNNVDPRVVLGAPDLIAGLEDRVVCLCGDFTAGPVTEPGWVTAIEVRCPSCGRVISFLADD